MSHTLASKADDAMKCRVFIGNLPNEAVTKDLLKSMFVQYGTYVDCSIYKNFGFVQYNDEQSANKAVQATNGNMMFDRRLDVKIAANGRKDSKAFPSGGVSKAKKPRMPMGDIRPMMGRNPYDPNMPYQQHIPMQPAPYPYPQHVPPVAPYPMSQMQSGVYPMQPLPNNRQPGYTPAPTTAQPPSTAPQQQSVSQSSDQTNNSRYCDIICTTKKQQMYAEFVEFNFTRLGFICSIVVLSSNYPADTYLNRSSRDGVPVAVSLKDDNENHRSINLHIFVGAPEEHRNMPLDVAEQFLKKRFNFASTTSQAQSLNQSSSSSQNVKSFSYSTQSSNSNQLMGQSSNNALSVDNKPLTTCDNPTISHGHAYSSHHTGYRGGAPPDSYYHGQMSGGYSQVGSATQPPYSGMTQYTPSNNSAGKRI